MRTIGSILMIIGCLVSVVGDGQVGSASCMCPVIIGGQAANCPCEYSPKQQMGFVITYVGITIVLGGIGFIVKPMVKRSASDL